ncbi:MAG: hypothetical protein ACRYG8_39285 [Janthinobacterium lividum]
MKLSRRAMMASAALAGASAAVPAAAVALPASVAPAAPDAALLWLCGEFFQAVEATNAVPDHDDTALSAVMAVRNALAERIGRTHPVSAAGLRAKAGVGAFLVREAYPSNESRDDVTGFAGDFLDGLSDTAINPDPGIVHPDAELLAACAVFDTMERQVSAFYEGPGRLDDDDQRQAAIDLVVDRQAPWLDRICDLRAVTPAGWKAKAQSLALWDQEVLQAKWSEGDVSERILATLLRDMLA